MDELLAFTKFRSRLFRPLSVRQSHDVVASLGGLGNSCRVGGDTGVEVANIDGGVESLVSEGVSHGPTDTRTVLAVVSVGPFGARVGDVFLPPVRNRRM